MTNPNATEPQPASGGSVDPNEIFKFDFPKTELSDETTAVVSPQPVATGVPSAMQFDTQAPFTPGPQPVAPPTPQPVVSDDDDVRIYIMPQYATLELANRAFKNDGDEVSSVELRLGAGSEVDGDERELRYVKSIPLRLQRIVSRSVYDRDYAARLQKPVVADNKISAREQLRTLQALS